MPKQYTRRTILGALPALASAPLLQASAAGQDVNEISGSVTEFGVVEFSGRDTDRSNGCASFYTDPRLTLAEQNTELTGNVRRSSNSDCVGRFHNEPGEMELNKVL